MEKHRRNILKLFKEKITIVTSIKLNTVKNITLLAYTILDYHLHLLHVLTYHFAIKMFIFLIIFGPS